MIERQLNYFNFFTIKIAFRDFSTQILLNFLTNLIFEANLFERSTNSNKLTLQHIRIFIKILLFTILISCLKLLTFEAHFEKI